MYVPTHYSTTRLLLHTWESDRTKKFVPVPAVPEPNSPEGVIPEFPFRGDFFAGIHL